MLSGPGGSHEGGSKQSKLWKSLPAQVAVKRDIRKRTSLATTAAEKKEKERTDQANQSELEICSSYSHRHLCNLIATCLDGPFRCMVFEFCPGGNLFDRLHPELLPRHDRKPMLSADQRLKIVAYAAQGLEYLHCAAIPPVSAPCFFLSFQF